MDPLTLGLVSGGVSLLGGVLGGNSKRKAQKEQQALQERQLDLSEREYMSKMQERQQWKEMYGGMEMNLLKYVKDLDADKIYGQAEGGLRKTFDISRQNMESHLASRGFDVAGGIHANMFSDLALKEAEMDMQYRQKAEDYTMQAQQSLLNNNPMPGVPSTTGMQNNLGNQANLAGQIGNYKANEWAGVSQFAGQVAGGMFGKASKGTIYEDIFNTQTGY